MFDPLPAVPDFTKTVLPATVVRWVDGDTVRLKAALPFGLTFEESFRLYGIDTPERGQAGHDEAWRYAAALAPAGSTLSISTYKDPDKYGRYLVVLGGGALTINDQLVLAGLAGLYAGGRKTGFVPTEQALAEARARVARYAPVPA